MKLHKIIEGYNTISIIGMEKNVGKTTVLNSILKEVRGKTTLGLTSIGRDGEDRDRVTYTHKPKIWVEKNTVLATAKEALLNSDITRDILETTGISTPMGEVVIVRALTGGYVDLAGPSISSQVSSVRDKMISYGADLIIVDGALGRMGTIYIDEGSAAILSTGASLASNMYEVVEKTSHRINLLQLKRIDNTTLKRYLDYENGERVVYLGTDNKKLNIDSVLETDRLIVDELDNSHTHIFIRGAVVASLIERLIKNRHKFEELTVVATDGTKFFIDSNLIKKAGLCGIKFRVCNEIGLIGLTCNPVSPFGYEFDANTFKGELKKITQLPVIDVIGG